MTWRGEKQRHSLAAKGIQSKYQYKSKGKPTLKVGLPDYTKDEVKHLSDIAEGKEWIAELSIINGNIIIDDIQVSDKIDTSYLRWNDGDEKKNVGYIHNHPQGIIPEFSSQDFILACEIHEIRTNKEQYPYTIMGMVYPEKDNIKIRMYGLNPTTNRKIDFEGLESTELDFQPLIQNMIKSKELVKLGEIEV